MLISTIFGAVIGGIAGLLSYLITVKFYKDKKKAQTISLIAMAGIIGGLMPLSNNPEFQMKVLSLISKDHAFQHELNQKLLTYVKDENFRAESESMGAMQLQTLVQQGLARLNDEQLMIWNQTRFTMTKHSKELCSALWNGNYQNVQFIEILRKLNPDELDLWLKVSANSLEAELAENTPNPPDQESLQRAMAAFTATLSPEEASKAQLIFAQGVKADADEACWLIKSLMQFAHEQSSGDGIHISRWFAMAAANTGK